MKKISLLVIFMWLAMVIVHAQQYVIQAELSGFADHTKFYLKDLRADINIDSAEIINGKFTMKGKSTTVKNYWLKTKSVYTNLLIGPEYIQVKGDMKDFPRDLMITGSKNQDVANILNNQTKQLWKSRDSIVNILVPYLMQKQSDSTRMITKPLGKKLNQIDSILEGITLRFIKENLNSYAALQEFYWKRKTYKKEEFEGMFNSLMPQFKASSYGQQIANYLKVGEPLKKGDHFYDFEAADTKGKKFKVSAYLGKYILLDFTETYCGPCILAVDDLKKLANKYIDQLQIISFYAESNKKIMQIGLDRDKPTWPSVWDGKGGYGEIILKYGVNGYPTFVLIDPNGKIVSHFSGFGKDDNGKGNVENEVDLILQKTK